MTAKLAQGAPAVDEPTAARHTEPVLSAEIDVVGWDAALARIEGWAQARESRYVCLCNVHSVMMAEDDPAFRDVVNRADMATPDGAPIAWSLRGAGHPEQERINGPDLMWKQLAESERLGLVVSFYGTRRETLDKLCAVALQVFPMLRIGCAIAPPYGDLLQLSRRHDAEVINAAGTQVLYVGLGCPKQELWMALQRGRIQAVMIGVGAAFDYHAGVVKRAPLWMRQGGLEWLHRLVYEPRRLARRYLDTNTRFLWLKFKRAVSGRPHELG